MEIKAKEITLFPVTKLSEYPRNANKHTDEQIEKIIQLIEFYGHRDPLIVDADVQPDGTHWVLAGNGRLQAAKKAGWDNLPCVFQVFKSDEEKYGFMVSHNAVSSTGWGGGLDLSQINVDITDLGPDFDIDMLGIKDFVIEPIEKFEPQSNEDDVPEVIYPITRRGDIWLLGNHRLMCGDSTMIDDVEKLMDGEKADMVFTDPPYKIETKGGTKSELSKSLSKQGESIEFIADFDPSDFLSVLPLFFNNNMNAYIFCNKELLPEYLTWARDSGYSFNVLIWKKPNAIPIRDSHRPDIEYLILFRKNAIWNYGLAGVNYSRCLEYGREKGLHPTMKPVGLIENEIRISSNSGSVVLDFFNGSGSTLMACEKTSRRYFGIELEGKYCDVTIKRWEQYTGKKATLESTGQTYEELKAERDASN